MSFLPMVERELRTAARRKSTYRLRWWTTVIALLATMLALPIALASGGRGGIGNPLFTIVSTYAFGLCLLSGVVLTADALSEERREGTLGLLFLTRLRGYDVVLGKFMARSLSAFYGLLAMLPVLALPLLAGGVTGGEFWRMTLALVNGLFVSLALAIGVSAFNQSSQRAMAEAAGLLLFLVAGLPAITAVAFQAGLPSGWAVVSWASPLYPFLYASAGPYRVQPDRFWGGLLGSNLIAWLALVIASVRLPPLYREPISATSGPAEPVVGAQPGAAALEARSAARTPLLEQHPVLWLSSREPGIRRLVWLLVTVWTAVVFVGVWLSHGDPGWVYVGAKACGFVLKLLLALEVCRFFVEGRRTGSLELLLCTPLTGREILRAHSLALKRTFLLPTAVFLGVSLIPFEAKLVPVLVRGNLEAIGQVLLQMGMGLAMLGWFCIGFILDGLAVIWFGRWLALAGKRPQLAPAFTIFYVLILPSLGFCGLDLLADILFILWGASSLRTDLRRFLTRI